MSYVAAASGQLQPHESTEEKKELRGQAVNRVRSERAIAQIKGWSSATQTEERDSAK